MDLEQSQSRVGVGQESQGGKKSFDEEMIDADAALEREKEEMKKIGENFDERT
jgi:hypothetical protein